MNHRVVVTGVGLVCALGIGTDQVWQKLLAGHEIDASPVVFTGETCHALGGPVGSPEETTLPVSSTARHALADGQDTPDRAE